MGTLIVFLIEKLLKERSINTDTKHQVISTNEHLKDETKKEKNSSLYTSEAMCYQRT